MSLITLTFGGRNTKEADSIGRGKVRVMKSDKFYGTDAICIIGMLVEGAVSTKMVLSGNGGKIQSVESKYGEESCARAGAKVVLMVSGIEKESYSAGDEMEFEKVITELPRPKGKIIIA